MDHVGIDEAGYGPLLGPLVIATTAADLDGPDSWLPFRVADITLDDSKRIHRPGDLAALERVALGGLLRFGLPPRTSAADLFAACDTRGDPPPWLAGADDLVLPIAAQEIRAWDLPGLERTAWRACIIQPRAINDAAVSGINKANLELEVVAGFVRRARDRSSHGDLVCDRLGGRRYYASALADSRRGNRVTVVEETQHLSRYRLEGDGGIWQVRFAVGGEACSPFTALASCIAKYIRELQMHLFNRWWAAAVPGLMPTAGYPEDAKRWLADLGPERLTPLGADLVRGWTGPSLFA